MLLFHLFLLRLSSPGLLGLGFVVVIIYLLYRYFFGDLGRIRSHLKSTPRKRISDIQSGETAQLHGTVVIIGDSLIAPLSERTCAYYHVIVERKVNSGRSSHWQTLIENEKNGYFLIKDGQNYAYIRRGSAMKHIVQDVHFTSGFLNDASEKLENFLAKHKEKSTDFLGFNKTIRYMEAVLEQDEKVVASGVCHWRQAKDVGLPEEYGRILEISANTETIAVISDDPDLMRYNPS